MPAPSPRKTVRKARLDTVPAPVHEEAPEARSSPDWREKREQGPARIAIIGAGPVGLEAALYARRLGMKALVFEREPHAAPDVRAWAHVSMFTPWSDNRTPLGEMALREDTRARRVRPIIPAAGLYPTGEQYVNAYLEPLAHLLSDSLHRETRVVGVGRSYLFPEDFADAPERREGRRFRLLTRSPLEERIFTADYVLDTSGVSHSPPWMGVGGLPALGEMGSVRHISYGIPDVLGRDRIRFLGKRTLLVGDGPSAATTALMLAEVVALDPPGSFVWATKGRAELPLPLIPNDPLPRRDLLMKKANLLVAGKHPGLEYLPLTQVEAVQHSLGTGRFQVTLQVDQVTRRIAFDAVIANVGSRRDVQTFESALQPGERGFFTLGAKAAPRDFFLRASRAQIRDTFRQITGDSDLDLYVLAQNALDSQARLAADEEMLRVA